jgi:ABC-type multidrug transport system fused ATPase/permease subunit
MRFASAFMMFRHVSPDVFRKIWRLLGADQKRFAVRVFAGMLLGTAFETVSIGAVIPALTIFSGPAATARSPFLTGVLERLGNPSAGALTVFGLLGLLLLYGIKSLVLLVITWQQARFLASIREDVATRLFKTYLSQPWAFHAQRNSSHLIRNSTTEVNIFVSGCGTMLSTAAEGFVTIGIATLLVCVEPAAALAVGAFLGVATWALMAALNRRLTRWGKLRQRAEQRRVKALQEGLGGIRDVKVFGREEEFFASFATAEQQASYALKMQHFSAQIPRLWYELLAVAGVAVLGVALFLQGVQSVDLVPRLGLFAVAAFRLMPSLNRIVGGIQFLRYLEPAVDVLSQELSLEKYATPINTNVRLKACGNIRLQDIYFTYPGSSEPAIRGVSLSILCGSAVGIIGESGAGKSTLIDLLLGLLTPQSGIITADGIDIQTRLRQWQNSVGYVPQSIFLTDDTIRANVAYGVPRERIDDAAVERALQAAQLGSFVTELPERVDTIVGERGVRLSGGQRQRIGIARALYWDPPILVLDEATSSLDTSTESGVMDAVNALHGRKTIIIIAHRMSTVSRCDELFRLSRGEISKANNHFSR